MMDRFLWKGPGTIWLDIASFASDLPQRIVREVGGQHRPQIGFPAFSRISRSAISEARLQDFIAQGQASLDDTGIAAPFGSELRAALTASMQRLGITDVDVEGKSAVKAILTAACGGLKPRVDAQERFTPDPVLHYSTFEKD